MSNYEPITYRIVQRFYQGCSYDYVVEADVYGYWSSQGTFDTYPEAKQFLADIKAMTIVNETEVYRETI